MKYGNKSEYKKDDEAVALRQPQELYNICNKIVLKLVE